MDGWPVFFRQMKSECPTPRGFRGVGDDTVSGTFMGPSYIGCVRNKYQNGSRQRSIFPPFEKRKEWGTLSLDPLRELTNKGWRTRPQQATGNFFWVQVVGNVTVINTNPDHTTKTCPNQATGLDTPTRYPYANNTLSTGDAPGVQLVSPYIETNELFRATMYLMWQPNLGSSIPIPLAYANWGWNGDAVYNGSSWSRNTWSQIPTNPAFTLSPVFPTWTSVVNGDNPGC
jgi:hypothetical protein